MLFGEWPFLDRFEAAAKARFRAVEYLFPYAFEARLLRQKLEDHQLLQVLHNLPAGDWANGERDRKSTRLNSSHIQKSRMPSSA